MITREDVESFGFKYLSKFSRANWSMYFKLEGFFEIGYKDSGYKCNTFYIRIFPDRPDVVIWATGVDCQTGYNKEIYEDRYETEEENKFQSLGGEKFFEGTINNKEELEIILKAIIHEW